MGACSHGSSVSSPYVGHDYLEKLCSFNKKSECKVYSRRRNAFTEGSLKAGEGKDRTGGLQVEDWQGLEDLQFDCNQSIDDSASNNSVSDMESLDCNEEESENEREKGEEAGLEGMRCLWGSQDGDLENLGVLGPQLVREEVLEQDGQGTIEDASGPELKIGKIGVPWQQINTAVGTLGLKLIENDKTSETSSVQSKPCRSLLRRKGGERELHNLKCSIDYDQGKQVQGIENDT